MQAIHFFNAAKVIQKRSCISNDSLCNYLPGNVQLYNDKVLVLAQCFWKKSVSIKHLSRAGTAVRPSLKGRSEYFIHVNMYKSLFLVPESATKLPIETDLRCTASYYSSYFFVASPDMRRFQKAILWRRLKSLGHLDPR